MTRLWPEGEPVQVAAGSAGTPQEFLWRGAWYPVAAIANRWRVRVSWWMRDGETWQEYVKLTTTDGLLCILARDLRDGAWRLVRLYD